MNRRVRTTGLLLAVGLVALMLVPSLVPIPDLQGTVPPASLADPDSRFADLNGLMVHFKAAGEGDPAILLLHGFGSSLFSWREVLAPLSQAARVVAYDRPAFGLTERPVPGSWDGESPYGAAAQVDLLLALMDAQAIDRAVLIGNSAGAAVAVRTALEHPDRVRALVLISPAVLDRAGSPLPAWIYRLPPVDHIGPLLARAFIGRGRTLIDLAWHDPGRISQQVRQEYEKPLQAYHWDVALWELMRTSQPLGLESRLSELGVPTLVLSGASDRIVPLADSQYVADQIPGATMVVLPECGHLPQEECPQDLLREVRRFLDGLSTSPASTVPDPREETTP